MPAKNSIKRYLENGYYHLYNRGVEKRDIFLDAQDYSTFLSYLKIYLLRKDIGELQRKLADGKTTYLEKDKILKLIRLNNFSDEISLLAYCLMPNHFHFLIKQRCSNSIDRFMNSLGTRYTMYFNRKYGRVGPLYQGQYKAVVIENEEYFLHLTRYIHYQANRESVGQPSSLADYLGDEGAEWVRSGEVLSYFSRTNPNLSYETFVFSSSDFGNLSTLLLED